MHNTRFNLVAITQFILLLGAALLLTACGGTLKWEPAADNAAESSRSETEPTIVSQTSTQNDSSAEVAESDAKPAANETNVEEPTAVPTAEPAADPVAEETAVSPTEPTPDSSGELPPMQQQVPAQTGTSAPLAGPGFACLGFDSLEMVGITCLGADGQWQSYNSTNSPLQIDYVDSMATCTDNSILIKDSTALHKFDGTNWQSFESTNWGFGTIQEMVCDASGNIWLGISGGVAHFDGASWAITDIHPETDFYSVEDIVIAEDGDVWIVTSEDAVGAFDGSTWTLYDGADFGDPNAYYFLEHITIDIYQRPWVLFTDGFLIFDGTNWGMLEIDGLQRAEEMLKAPNGNIWTITNEYGVLELDFEAIDYAAYNSETSPISSNFIMSMDVDASGRIWFGTKWGVNVFDGSNWVAYHMDNAPLMDNFIGSVAVAGSGPTLPSPIPQGNGTMVGRVMLDGQPLPDTTIEICPEEIHYHTFYGPTPCSDQGIYYSATTDSDGRFSFTDVARGRYVIVIATAGGWTQLKDPTRLDEVIRIPVMPGEETYLGEILFVSGTD